MSFKRPFKKQNYNNSPRNKGPDYCHICGTRKTLRLCKCYKVKVDENGKKYKKYSGFGKVIKCCLKCAKNKH
jgi:hypothetical protein